MSTGLKAIKGGKTEEEFFHRTITLRGVEYKIRELSVVEYKQCLAEATKEGSTPFQDLLDVMVLRCVSPSPAERKTPMPYPVYRTLEDIVNVMHFITLPDESKQAKADDDAADAETDDEEAADPNSSTPSDG